LRRYTADLAVSLAETKVRARMTPEAQESLVKGFVQNLK
jgi:F0F1-type ATP synthase membrane subunit b/b'